MEFTIVNKIVLLCAKRCSGKSILIKKLIQDEQQSFKKIYLISPTEKIDNFYTKDNVIKKENVFDSWSEKWAGELVKKMSEINIGKLKTDSNFTHILLVLDDLIADTNFHNSEMLKILFVRSRHFGVSIILSAQYLHSLSPLQRSNCDFIITSSSTQYSIDILINEFLPSFIDRKEFLKIYSDCTKDYSFLVINNNSVKNNTVNEVFGRIKVNSNEI